MELAPYMFLVISLFFIKIYCCCCQERNTTIPFTLQPHVIKGNGIERCPENIGQQTKVEIKRLLPNVNRILNQRYGSPCACGNQREWIRIAHLDMTDTSQNCPSNWTLISSPVRGCGQSTTSCDSAFYSSNGRNYSRVCGSIIAYQHGEPDAFWFSIAGSPPRTLDQSYITGISLTHGAVGARQHIWSFVAAMGEIRPRAPRSVCSCTDTRRSWGYTTPSYVGNDYFCATGNRGPGWSRSAYYPNDPLWDGEGCGPTSSCCEFNNPPWFCKELPQPTRNDLEIRNCGPEFSSSSYHEDVIVTSMDVYIQ